jgi:DNA-binding MarR family transcriptional regulator
MTDPEELAKLVSDFGKAYARWIAARTEHSGTTPARARLLSALQCRGSCPMNEIGAVLCVTPRSITKLVDGLEAEGLVVRGPHPTDRRVTLLTLTAKGLYVSKESAMANYAAIAQLYEHLSVSDQKALKRILGQLLEVLTQPSPVQEC